MWDAKKQEGEKFVTYFHPANFQQKKSIAVAEAGLRLQRSMNGNGGYYKQSPIAIAR
ncbi:MAG TPA: hypothetical protein VGM92_06535 [Candidatus Kapabacteria bacterium]|jgi:hypothetical protein